MISLLQLEFMRFCWMFGNPHEISVTVLASDRLYLWYKDISVDIIQWKMLHLIQI